MAPQGWCRGCAESTPLLRLPLNLYFIFSYIHSYIFHIALPLQLSLCNTNCIKKQGYQVNIHKQWLCIVIMLNNSDQIIILGSDSPCHQLLISSHTKTSPDTPTMHFGAFSSILPEFSAWRGGTNLRLRQTVRAVGRNASGLIHFTRGSRSVRGLTDSPRDTHSPILVVFLTIKGYLILSNYSS